MSFEPSFNFFVYSSDGKKVGHFDGAAGTVTLEISVKDPENPHIVVGPGTFHVGSAGSFGLDPMLPSGLIAPGGVVYPC